MLPAKKSSNNWGWFGYEGSMVDGAIIDDNLKDLQECVKRGFIEPTSEVIGALSIVDHCRKKKAVKCEAWLRKQGWV